MTSRSHGETVARNQEKLRNAAARLLAKAGLVAQGNLVPKLLADEAGLSRTILYKDAYRPIWVDFKTDAERLGAAGANRLEDCADHSLVIESLQEDLDAERLSRTTAEDEVASLKARLELYAVRIAVMSKELQIHRDTVADAGMVVGLNERRKKALGADNRDNGGL